MKRNLTSEYFPKNYVESRARFVEDAKLLGPEIKIGKWNVPSRADSDLTVDYIWAPPKIAPKNLLVLLSGIHGSETYAGSAVLHYFVRELMPGLQRDNLGVLAVHAMNPYGFKYHNRCTENHVNLNRNFSIDGELFKVKNPASAEMHKLFYTRKPVEAYEGKILRSMKRVGDQIFFGDVSADQLRKAIAPGQFETHEDVEFGGREPEPQTKALTELMRTLMPDYQNVVALDIHTGLGDRDRLHLLTDGVIERTLNPILTSQVLHSEEDKEFYEFTPAEAEGFYQVHGATNSLFGDLATKQQRVCAITLEFGTLGHSLEQQAHDMNAFMVTHQGQVYGYANSEIEKLVRERDFERSYPATDRWREKVMLASEGMLTRLTQRLTQI